MVKSRIPFFAAFGVAGAEIVPVIAPESRQSLSSRAFETAIPVARKIRNRNATHRVRPGRLSSAAVVSRRVHRDDTGQHRAAQRNHRAAQSRGTDRRSKRRGMRRGLSCLAVIQRVCLSAKDALYPAGEPRVRNAAVPHPACCQAALSLSCRVQCSGHVEADVSTGAPAV
jgi:hypothetical protein